MLRVYRIISQPLVLLILNRFLYVFLLAFDCRPPVLQAMMGNDFETALFVRRPTACSCYRAVGVSVALCSPSAGKNNRLKVSEAITNSK